MKILITGGCGFIGSNLAIFLKKKKFKVYSLDNLFRKGSNLNLSRLKKNQIKNYKIDISNFEKIKKLPKFDLIIDCCAEPAINISKKEINRVIYTNFIGTFNILKKSVKDNSKLIFLSSSRVYPLKYLNNLVNKSCIDKKIKIKKRISMLSPIDGIRSVYGFSKLASEELIKEFSYISNLKFIINRFGVVAGPWQFGKVDQGFFSLWIWCHMMNKPLKYIGYGGHGNQVRDLLHIYDLCELIFMQIKRFNKIYNKSFTVGGDIKNSISLKELTRLSEKVTGNKIKIKKEKKTSIYDVPYFVTSNDEVKKNYNWKPKNNLKKMAKDVYNWQKENIKLLKNYLN